MYAKRAEYDQCEICIYCDLAVRGSRHEHDHAPIPKSAGGLNTVTACVSCHDLKDRAALHQWPSRAVAGAVEELLKLELLGATPAAHLPSAWPTMSRYGRILWARIHRSLHSDPAGDIQWSATVRKIHDRATVADRSDHQTRGMK